MSPSKIYSILTQGEGLRIEFKKCTSCLTKDVYETVCAFLNRSGGELLLGVDDKGIILGIDAEYINQIKNDFVTTVNNNQKITPSFYLSIEEVVIENKIILYIYIPESSQVHRCNGKIYDRNEDGDFNITDNNHLVSTLFLKKQNSYSENKIFPYAEIVDLRSDTIARVRKLATVQREDHPWNEMSDIELLQSAQLYKKDFQTGQHGFTLAGLLLFGKDETIISVLPHFKTDAILRKENQDRYDDRDDIRTNLVDSYDRLLNFGEKHLKDPFYLQNDQRISLRNYILREVISNLIIHREYTSPFPAKFVIDQEKFYTENNNKPHHIGLIDPWSFSPYPKNPIIARVFKEIGRADELGSGVRNLYQYCKVYCGQHPEFREGDIFTFTLFFEDQVAPQATPQATPQAAPQADRVAQVMEFCQFPRSREEIQTWLGLKDRKHFRAEILNPLIAQGMLQLTIPERPTSPRQKYYSPQREIDNE